MTSATSLGERIRTARRQRGLSQSQLAGEELTKGFISQVESGLVRPSLRSLQLIASRLEKSLDYFLGDEPLTSSKRVAFHQLAARTAAERGDWAAVRAEAAAALEHAREPRERARFANLLAAADIAAHDHEAAFTRITEALAVLDPATDATDVAYLLYRRGVAYAQLGQLVAASEAFESARAVVDQYEITDPRLRTRLLVNLGTTYRRLNRTTKALATYEHALAVSTTAAEIEMAARSYMGLAASLADSGEFDAAIGNYQRALTLWERLSDTALELGVLHSLAETHLEAGDVARARLMAERCLVRAELLGDVREAAIARTELARVALAEGRPADALAMATDAAADLEAQRDPRQRASALRVAGAARHALGEHAASDEAYGLAITLVESIDHLADRSQIAAEYARKLRERGDLDRAFDMLELARGSASRR